MYSAVVVLLDTLTVSYFYLFFNYMRLVESANAFISVNLRYSSRIFLVKYIEPNNQYFI